MVAPAAGLAPQNFMEIQGPYGTVTCGQTVTLTVKDCAYCCIHWFYNGSYTVTNTGSFTFVADGSITEVHAVKFFDCVLGGTIMGSDTRTIYYASSCP